MGKARREGGIPFPALNPDYKIIVKLSPTRLMIIFLSPYSHFVQNSQSFTIPAVFGLME